MDDSSTGGLEFSNIFLLTYRTFMKTKDLMAAIIQKWEHIYKIESEDVRRKYCLRVCNFLRRWVENFFHDFEGDHELLDSYDKFVTNMETNKQEPLLAGYLRRAMSKMTGKEHNPQLSITFDCDAPKPVLPKEVGERKIMFSDIRPVELARQLTLAHYGMYRKIPPKEFLSLSWQKEDKERRSPNLLHMIRDFNRISWWIVNCLVQEGELRRRAKILKNIMKLIGECAKLNNFNAVFALIAGLNSAPIHRLKKTWEVANATKSFEEWTVLTANRGSWKAYRDSLHHADPPCIPYLGVYLSDLTFIEENKTHLENGMVNVFKCRKVADVISEIQQYQQKPYNLKPVESIQQLIHKADVISERLAFKLSLKIEPRESQVL